MNKRQATVDTNRCNSNDWLIMAAIIEYFENSTQANFQTFNTITFWITCYDSCMSSILSLSFIITILLFLTYILTKSTSSKWLTISNSITNYFEWLLWIQKFWKQFTKSVWWGRGKPACIVIAKDNHAGMPPNVCINPITEFTIKVTSVVIK